LVAEIIGGSADSKPSSPSASADSFFEEANERSSTSTFEEEEAPADKPAKTPTKKASPSLDDLYNDL